MSVARLCVNEFYFLHKFFFPFCYAPIILYRTNERGMNLHRFTNEPVRK